MRAAGAMRPRRYAQLAAVIFLAQAMFAVVHRISGGEYGHFIHVQNVLVDLSLAVLWLGGAAGCLVRRSMVAFFAVLLAALASYMHGIMFSVAAPGTGYGVPFLVASALLPLLVALSSPAWKVRPEPTEVPRAHGAGLRPRHA
jgi:hypothetical protein